MTQLYHSFDYAQRILHPTPAVFIAALSTIGRKWKQAERLLTDKWVMTM